MIKSADRIQLWKAAAQTAGRLEISPRSGAEKNTIFAADLAAVLAIYADVSYFTAEQGTREALSSGAIDVTLIHDSQEEGSYTSTEALAVRFPGVAVISFRGTQEKEDLATDVDVRLTPWVPTTQRHADSFVDSVSGKSTDWGANFSPHLHRGMFEAYDSVRIKVERYLDQILADDKEAQAEATREGQPSPAPTQIYFTGHSLGGGLAVIAAAEAKKRDISVAAVYTYGQPRVGDRAFATQYEALGLNDLTFRVVNQNDIVPSIPPPLLYSHVGQEIYFNGDGEIVKPATSLLESATQGVSNLFDGLTKRQGGMTDALEDHRIEQYRQVLARASAK